MYADSEFSGSVDQRDHSPHQPRNEEVGDQDRKPAACARLRVKEVRQGEYRGWHDRQKNAVAPDKARTLHNVSAKEKLLGGGLDGGKNQCDWDEECER